MFNQSGGDSPVPQEHDYEDSDRSSLAGHHTLGIHKYQASPGDHTHKANDPNSLPVFDGVDVDLTDLPLEDQVGKIWEIIADYGGSITFPSPSEWYGDNVTYFNHITTDQPSLKEVTLNFTGTQGIVLLSLNSDFAYAGVNGIEDFYVITLTGVTMPPVFAESLGEFRTEAAGWAEVATDTFTATVELRSTTPSGCHFCFTDAIHSGISNYSLYENNWFYEGGGDTSYRIANFDIPNMGATDQISLIHVIRVSEIDTTGEVLLDIPPENIIALDKDLSGGDQGTFYIIVNYAGTVTPNEDVSTVSMLTVGLT